MRQEEVKNKVKFSPQGPVFRVKPEQTRKKPKEIDWDCPCLDSMKKSPCGENFKAAFSCYVNSDAEMKGSDCFEDMKQFRLCVEKHREYYEAMAKEEHHDDQSPL